ncbi:MAG TPA: hypothetical protein VIJ87_08555, partial [Pyrinomonadaceae bacterium]
TCIPILRLPTALRQEEDRLAQEEATSLNEIHRATESSTGDEVFLPYAFVQRETCGTGEKSETGEKI